MVECPTERPCATHGAYNNHIWVSSLFFRGLVVLTKQCMFTDEGIVQELRKGTSKHISECATSSAKTRQTEAGRLEHTMRSMTRFWNVEAENDAPTSLPIRFYNQSLFCFIQCRRIIFVSFSTRFLDVTGWFHSSSCLRDCKSIWRKKLPLLVNNFTCLAQQYFF